MTKAEYNAKFPLTAPTCPYCKTQPRRRRYWERWTRVVCKKCGAWGELMPHGPARSNVWQWMADTVPTKRF